MAGRGSTRKTASESQIRLERAMITRHYVMTWDLERCVGCQIGPAVCPKDAINHVEGEILDGRLAAKPSVDVDAEKCVLCGICEVMCPKNAVTVTVNGERENPVLEAGAFPDLIQSTVFDGKRFDWSRKDFVIDNCPTGVISYDEENQTLLVDDDHCIRCRQCVIASNGAFEVHQPWQGSVTLRREKCVEGCFACADVCPTRALRVNNEGELKLADYFCIKCGACMQVCPVKAEYETYEVSVEVYGVLKTVEHARVTNTDDLPIIVERWRVRHKPVQSAAWVEALTKVADERAGAVEIDAKRALKRRDLLKALAGSKALWGEEEE